MLVFLVVASGCRAEALKVAAIPADLKDYVERSEPESKWELVSKSSLGVCDFWHIKLKSQVWQGIAWEHDLLIFVPQGITHGDKMLLINNGGKFDPKKMDRAMLGVMLAQRVKAPVAVLLGIPNQPLFNNLREDHLIAETFVRYLDTGDSTWPLLFPMVKSVVKSMDALQEFSRQTWQKPVEKFVITGASKRGWTTWLTAAVDERVMAIAPMVIDVVNISEQLPHQTEAFGKPSEQIHPYTARGLVPLPDTERARRLWTMVDPWTYRSAFTMPKMIVLGNNDRYWTTDALNLYWDGLPGEKYISYTPNAGHNLTEIGPDGKKGSPMRSVDNVAAFVRQQFQQKPLPKLTWQHDDTADGQLQLTVSSDVKPKKANLWYATADSRDFRDARWQSRPVEMGDGGRIHLTHPYPETGYVAYYVDLGYDVDEITLWLCTQLRIASRQSQASSGL